MKKSISAVLLAIAVFGAGFYVNELRWQEKHTAYQLEEKAKQEIARKTWETKLNEAENVLAESRIDQSRSADELEWMRQRVNDLERSAKTAEARWGARCARLAVRYREAVERAKPALRFCAEILK